MFSFLEIRLNKDEVGTLVIKYLDAQFTAHKWQKDHISVITFHNNIIIITIYIIFQNLVT